MNKLMKRVIPLILVVVMCASMAAPAFASEMSGFPEQKTTDYTARYTRAIQVMLINFNSSTRSSIINNGGVDAIYGNGTAAGVAAFQMAKKLTQDGICGPNTWSAFRKSLIYQSKEGGYYMYKGDYPYYANKYNMKQYDYANGSWYCYYAGTWHYVG